MNSLKRSQTKQLLDSRSTNITLVLCEEIAGRERRMEEEEKSD